jgi:hypothetical protein
MIFAIRSSLKRWKRFQRDFFPDKLDSNLRHRYNLIMRRVNEMRGGNNQFTWQDAVLGMRRSGEAASQETPTKEAFQALLDRAEIEYNQWAQPGPVELLQEAFQVVPEEVRVVPPKLRMTLGYRTNP